VLEGVGLIARCDKSAVRWVGRRPDPPVLAVVDPGRAREAEVNAMMQFTDKALADLLESERFEEHGWLSEEDIARADPGGALDLFAIRGPPTMTVEIVDDGGGLHHMICRGDRGRIDMIPLRSAARRNRNTQSGRPWLKAHVVDQG
jgi:hypothetical protein